MRTVWCTKCWTDHIREDQVTSAKEVGRIKYDGQEEWKTVSWRWNDANGHHGYGGEPMLVGIRKKYMDGREIVVPLPMGM